MIIYCIHDPPLPIKFPPPPQHLCSSWIKKKMNLSTSPIELPLTARKQKKSKKTKKQKNKTKTKCDSFGQKKT